MVDMADCQSVSSTATPRDTVHPETVLQSIELDSFDKRLAEDKSSETSSSFVPQSNTTDTYCTSPPKIQEAQRNKYGSNTSLIDPPRQKRSGTPSPSTQRVWQAGNSTAHISAPSYTTAVRFGSHSDSQNGELLTSQSPVHTVTPLHDFDPYHNLNTDLPDITDRPDLHGTLQRRLEAYNDFTAPGNYLSNAFPLDESLLSMHGRLHTTYLIKTISSIKCDQCKARCKKGGEVYQCDCCKAQICQDCVEERLERATTDAQSQRWEWNSWNHEPFKHAYLKREADRGLQSSKHKGWKGKVGFDCPELKGWTEVTVKLRLVTNNHNVNATNKKLDHHSMISDSDGESSNDTGSLFRTMGPTKGKRKLKTTIQEDQKMLDISEAAMGSESATLRKMRKWQEAAGLSSGSDQRNQSISSGRQTTSSSSLDSLSTPPQDTPTTITPSDATDDTDHNNNNKNLYLQPRVHRQIDIHTIATRIALARALPLFNIVNCPPPPNQQPSQSRSRFSHLIDLNRNLPEPWQIRFDQGDGFDQFGDFIGARGIIYPSGRREQQQLSNQLEFTSERGASSSSSGNDDEGVCINNDNFITSGVTSNIEHEEFRRARLGGYADELRREVEVLFASLMGRT